MGTQLRDLLIEKGSELLRNEEMDKMMAGCGVGYRFKNSDR